MGDTTINSIGINLANYKNNIRLRRKNLLDSLRLYNKLVVSREGQNQFTKFNKDLTHSEKPYNFDNFNVVKKELIKNNIFISPFTNKLQINQIPTNTQINFEVNKFNIINGNYSTESEYYVGNN
jgi:hypothetical protein